MTLLPSFQAQNPAISGYPLGWSSCTSFAFAMASHYDRQRYVMSGGQLRTRTGDVSGGTNLSQNDFAARAGWAIDLDTRFRYPWADFVRRINAGQAAVLQGWYGPIADARFDAGRGFRGNHAITVLPGFIVMDPLADGRATGVYKYRGEAYPQALLKDFAGRLNVGTSYSALGSGLVYASFTRDQMKSYRASVNGPHGVYTVQKTVAYPNGIVTGSRIADGAYSAACTAPALYPWKGHTPQSLVQLLDGSHKGRFIRSAYSREV